MTDLGWPELLIVAVIAMLLFGTKKMPDMARSIGRSMRIVKAELSGLHDDEHPDAHPDAHTEAHPEAHAPAATAPAAAGPPPEPVAEPPRSIEPPTR